MVRRALNDNEKALWGLVIASVKPMHAANPKPVVAGPVGARSAGANLAGTKAALVAGKPPRKPAHTPAKSLPINTVPAAKPVARQLAPSPVHVPSSSANSLDGSWDRKISKGVVIPDVSVDLHGSGLASAYGRLDGALEQAIAQNMRVILLVTGKVRNHDRASGAGRGAIASVVRDWLGASRHANSISAVRNAHPRHGGTGALYIILKR